MITDEDLKHFFQVVKNFDHCCLKREDHFGLIQEIRDLRQRLISETDARDKRVEELEQELRLAKELFKTLQINLS
jgi:hypothetical protein